MGVRLIKMDEKTKKQKSLELLAVGTSNGETFIGESVPFNEPVYSLKYRIKNFTVPSNFADVAISYREALANYYRGNKSNGSLTSGEIVLFNPVSTFEFKIPAGDSD